MAPPVAPQGGRSDPDSHEWVSFEDAEEDRTWLLDVTFLASSWNCIFGCGCQGVLTEPAAELAQGCCSYGAHFSSAADVERVETAAAALKESEWQFAERGRERGVVARRHGSHGATRLVEDACIFLNRPGFEGGAGCALHSAALSRGIAPLSWKPDVCWQLPLRRQDLRDDQGHVTSVVGEWDRRHWGEAGEEFAWWCTEAPEAFTGSTAVYKEMRLELTELVGEAIFERLVQHLESRRQASPLPHPTVRKR